MITPVGWAVVFKDGLLMSLVFAHANNVNARVRSVLKLCFFFACCWFAVVRQANGCCAPSLLDSESHPVVKCGFFCKFDLGHSKIISSEKIKAPLSAVTVIKQNKRMPPVARCSLREHLSFKRSAGR